MTTTFVTGGARSGKSGYALRLAAAAGSPVVLIATAEARGASGRELLAAVVVGNEIVARLGIARAGAFHDRGFHPTSVCGIFGATAAVWSYCSRVSPCTRSSSPSGQAASSSCARTAIRRASARES